MIQNKIITGNIGDDSISLINLDNSSEAEMLLINNMVKINGRIGPWDLITNEKGQLLILNSYNESLITFDLETKGFVSKTKLGRSPVCIRIFNNKIYILNCDSNSLSILDEDSLTLVEEIYLDEKPIDLQIDFEGNKAYIANSNGNSINIIDLLDKTIESICLNCQPFRLLIDETTIFILSYINNGVINYSSITSMDKINKNIKTFKVKGIYNDFVKIDENIFLLTNPDDGYLYSFNVEDKSLMKKVYLGGMPNKMIWDEKDTLYITDLLNNQVVIVDIIEEVLLNKIKVGKEPQGFILL